MALVHGKVILLSLSAAALWGCGGLDPWGQMSKVARDPSGGLAQSAGATSQPAGEIKDGKVTPAGGPLRLVECIWIALERNPQTMSS